MAKRVSRAVRKTRNQSFSSPSWGLLLQRLPFLTFSVLHSTSLALRENIPRGFQREYRQTLHWQILGDILVHFFRRGGPVLTKFGQILATREDILPLPICQRLESLFNRQEPMSEADLLRVIKKVYGRRNPFQEFDKGVLGVGSVGEVHRATLHSGEKVIVKILRVGVKDKIQKDIVVAKTLIQGLFKFLGVKYRSTGQLLFKLIEDLERGFLTELNLKKEAESLTLFHSRLKDHPKVYAPKCYLEYSNKEVLVIEELGGESLADYRKKKGIDSKKAKELADIALREIFRQIFDQGVFHADPHSGNLMVLDDGRLGLIDFGLTGEFTREDRRAIGTAVRAFLRRDPDELIKALLKFGSVPEDFSLQEFKKDVVKTVKSQESLQKTDVLINQLFKVAYRHHIYVPESTTLLIKTLVTIEGVAKSLDPEVNVISIAIPVILQSMTPKWLRFKFWE